MVMILKDVVMVVFAVAIVANSIVLAWIFWNEQKRRTER